MDERRAQSRAVARNPVRRALSALRRGGRAGRGAGALGEERPELREVRLERHVARAHPGRQIIGLVLIGRSRLLAQNTRAHVVTEPETEARVTRFAIAVPTRRDRHRVHYLLEAHGARFETPLYEKPRTRLVDHDKPLVPPNSVREDLVVVVVVARNARHRSAHSECPMPFFSCAFLFLALCALRFARFLFLFLFLFLVFLFKKTTNKKPKKPEKEKTKKDPRKKNRRKKWPN